MPNIQTGQSGMRYVSRGDVADYDWRLGDFTTDGEMRDLDLSAIIPVGTILVAIGLSAKDNAGSKYLQFRTNGFTNLRNIESRFTQGANIQHSSTLWLAPDVNGVIEYRIQSATWSIIDMVVLGWFI